MNPVEEALKFAAKIVGGEFFIYDDGYIIEIGTGAGGVRLNYENDGTLVDTKSIV